MSSRLTPPQDQPIQSHRETSKLNRSMGFGGIVIALLIGIQLGAIPWRYRREIWQLQGLLVGAGLGYVVGRFSRSDDQSKGQGTGQPNDRP